MPTIKEAHTDDELVMRACKAPRNINARWAPEVIVFVNTIALLTAVRLHIQTCASVSCA